MIITQKENTQVLLLLSIYITKKFQPSSKVQATCAVEYSGLNGKTVPLYDWDDYYPTMEQGYDAGNQLQSEKNRVRALVDKTKVTEVND